MTTQKNVYHSHMMIQTLMKPELIERKKADGFASMLDQKHITFLEFAWIFLFFSNFLSCLAMFLYSVSSSHCLVVFLIVSIFSLQFYSLLLVINIIMNLINAVLLLLNTIYEK